MGCVGLGSSENRRGTLKQIARLELTAGSDRHVLGRVRLRASQRGVDGLAVGAVGGLNQTGWQRRITGVGSPATLDRRERPSGWRGWAPTLQSQVIQRIG